MVIVKDVVNTTSFLLAFYIGYSMIVANKITWTEKWGATMKS